MSENTNTPELVNLTAYTAWKVANAVFEKAGLDYRIAKPQQMYGKRKSIGTDAEGRLIAENFKAWLDKTVEEIRNAGAPTQGERANYAALADAYVSNNGHADTHEENEDQELVDGVSQTEAELDRVEAE